MSSASIQNCSILSAFDYGWRIVFNIDIVGAGFLWQVRNHWEMKRMDPAGNRTLISGMHSQCSTIELTEPCIISVHCVFVGEGGGGLSPTTPPSYTGHFAPLPSPLTLLTPRTNPGPPPSPSTHSGGRSRHHCCRGFLWQVRDHRKMKRMDPAGDRTLISGYA